MDETMLPLEMDHLPQFFVEKAEKEINYSPSIVEKSLREIREKIAKDDSLKSSVVKDDWLLVFLTCRKFDLERAFQHLKKFANYRRTTAYVFVNPTFDFLSAFMTTGMLTLLPYRCPDGCTLLSFNCGKYDASKHSVESMKRVVAFVVTQSLRLPMTRVNGFKLIIDLDASWDFMKICTPPNAHFLLYGVLVISPARFKAIHLLNATGIGKIVWQLAKVFVPGKIKQRVYFHKKSESLMEHFPKAIIPDYLGGDLKEHDMTEWIKDRLSEEMPLFGYQEL